MLNDLILNVRTATFQCSYVFYTQWPTEQYTPPHVTPSSSNTLSSFRGYFLKKWIQFQVSNCLAWLKVLGSLQIFTRDNGRQPLIFIEKASKRLKKYLILSSKSTLVLFEFYNFEGQTPHPPQGIFRKYPRPPGGTLLILGPVTLNSLIIVTM